MADTTTTQPSTKLGTLNLAEHAVLDSELTLAADHTYPDPTPPSRVLMLDIESLALGTRPVITQVALIGYDLEEDELLDTRHVQFYPVDPQQQIIPPRRIMASTIAWWMKQSDEARVRFEQSVSDDFAELPALARHLIATVNQLTDDGKIPYEIVAKGPQFDVAAVETLLEDLGLKTPWDYRNVRDLRTLLATAGINEKNIPKPAGFVPHVAYWDARWQLNQYLAARRRLAGR
jgi:hypothetical protein